MTFLSSDLVDAGVLPPASPETSIWRYLTLERFTDLLQRRALFFARASVFEDQFEGSFPITQPPRSRVEELIKDRMPPGARIVGVYGVLNSWTVMRRWVLASCWHASDYESAAMWALYGGAGRSIAIRTTVQRLMTALGEPPPVAPGFHGPERFQCGMVGYIDYRTDRIAVNNYLLPFYRKRKSFEHEKELRVTVPQRPLRPDGFFDQEREPTDPGRYFPVNLDTLMEAVFVAPGTPLPQKGDLERLVATTGLRCTVQQSDLDADPLY